MRYLDRQRITCAIAGIALCVAAMLPATGAGADDRQSDDCGNALVRVTYVSAADRDHACEALRRAHGFLVGEQGLVMRRPLAITFLDRVEIDCGDSAIRILGRYDQASQRIEVTSAAAEWLSDSGRRMFGLPLDDDLHISLITHEIAHAITKENYRIPQPGSASEEYIAYVTQIATLQPETRDRVLRNYAGKDFQTVDEITEILHQMRPHEFGVRAYRHFVREGHTHMIDDILSGRFRTFMPEMMRDGE